MKKDVIGGIVRQKRKGKTKDSAVVRVTVNGKTQTVYLGVYGSDEADENYRRIARQFYSGSFVPAVDQPTISDVYKAYLAEINQKGVETKSDLLSRYAIEYSMEVLNDFDCCNISVDVLSKYQAYLVSIANEKRQRHYDKEEDIEYLKKGVWTRQYINKIFTHWKRVIKFGINKGMIPYPFLPVLDQFPQVKKQPGLKEHDAIEAVDDEVVLATIKYTTPTVADMVKVIRGSCLRPGECCRLKVGDITFNGETSYCGSVHNKIKGHIRFIAFDRACTGILIRRCQGKQPDDYVFSPAESQVERFDGLRANRKTKRYRYQIERDKSREETRLDKYGDHWTPDDFRNSINYAIDKANKNGENVEHWTPYQLRHASFTANAIEYGVDVASKIAGHSSVDMSKVYDHSARIVSMENAEGRRAWWE